MKNINFLRWQPAYHWTNQKLKVHGFYCVLALLLATLAHKVAVQKPLLLERSLARRKPSVSELSVRGGTDFPLALYHALKTTEKSRAHKKIVFMLTDGDINGSISTDDLLRYAKHKNTNVFTIGIAGSDEAMLKETLGAKKRDLHRGYSHASKCIEKKSSMRHVKNRGRDYRLFFVPAFSQIFFHFFRVIAIAPSYKNKTFIR